MLFEINLGRGRSALWCGGRRGEPGSSSTTRCPGTFETDYWAPDDPQRAALGITDPQTLAFIQTLAGEDPRVSLTLRNGKHRNVLTYVARLTTTTQGRCHP